ncbi:zinc finger protein 532-like isoform X2 [Ptychodera flava]
MSTEVKTPDFDDLLAAYDIPDLAEKASSSLSSENATASYTNSGQEDVKNKGAEKDVSKVVKEKEEESGKERDDDDNDDDDDTIITDDEDDKLVIDEKTKTQESSDMKSEAHGVDSTDDSTKESSFDMNEEKESSNVEGDDVVSKPVSENKERNDKNSTRKHSVSDGEKSTVGESGQSTAAEDENTDIPPQPDTTLKKETIGHSCAAEQLKQLSESYIRDKEKEAEKAAVTVDNTATASKESVNSSRASNKLTVMTATTTASQKIITSQVLQNKSQVKIAPKPLVTNVQPSKPLVSSSSQAKPLLTSVSTAKPLLTSVNPAKLVAVTAANKVLPTNVTTSSAQKLLVLTTGSPGCVTNALNVAKPKLSAPPTSQVTAAIETASSMMKSSIIDALENSGPTVNVVVPNNLLKRSNPVPRYVPKMPPKEWNLNVPDGGYKCMECNDAFVLETSLSMHLERRSMNIAYVCEICNKKLVFYNKCSLLRHVRLHYSKSAKNITVSLKSVEVSPLSKNITSLWPSRDRLGLPASYQENESSMQMPSQPHCTECNVVFANCQARKLHFQANANIKLSENFICSICGLQCPNKCYFQAHQRIHQNQSPYVCPECGEEKYDRELFYVHLNSTCIHFCRQAVYKCPQCNAGYPNITHLKTHLQNSHTDSFCKCPVCPMAFKSVENINNHMQAQHKMPNQGFRVIHKCPMCDTVFTQKSNLPVHLDSHLMGKDMRIYVFKCNECYKHYDSKEVLEKHQLSVHKGAQLKDFICDVCRTPFKTYQFMLQHKNKHFDSSSKLVPVVNQAPVSTAFPKGQMTSTSSASALQCSVCFKAFQKKDDLLAHRKEHEKEGVFMCTKCNMKFSQKELLADHMQQHEKKPANKNTCPDCGTVFSKWANLNKHAKHTHGKVSQYPCHLCKRSFEANKSLQRHLRIKHKLSHAYTCWHCADGKKTFTKRSLLEKHLLAVHNIIVSAKHGERQPGQTTTPMSGLISRKRKSTNSSDSGKRAKFEFSSEYKCFKCEFTSKVRSEFQTHIRQHKTDQSLSQCRECGMCFRGDESLKKHLYMTHKVRDIGEYEMAVNRAEQKGSNSDSQDRDGKTAETCSSGSVFKSSQDSALECNVCYRSFDNEIALRTHMRNHGMAFIRSKRCNSADSQ